MEEKYFLVAITETNYKTVAIKADSDEEATQKVRDMYENADIVCNDTCDVIFDTTELKKEDLKYYDEVK